MDTRTREAIRYLGYGKHAIDNQTFSLVLEAFDELDRIVEKRMIYRIFNIHMSGDDRMEIENIKIQSKNLAKNLCGCEKVVLLGATLGVQVDQLMKRYAYTNMAKTVVLQACAAAMLEEYLDDWQENLAQELSVDEYGLRPRIRRLLYCASGRNLEDSGCTEEDWADNDRRKHAYAAEISDSSDRS